MKNLKFAALLGLLVSCNSFAADGGSAIATGVEIPNTIAGCSLLSEPVTLNLSNGVVGAYACNTDDNVIGVAACHPNGRKSVTFDCDPTATGEDLVTGCTAVGGGAAATVGTATATEGVAYRASTRGGRVDGVPAEACTGTTATTVAEAQAAAGL